MSTAASAGKTKKTKKKQKKGHEQKGDRTWFKNQQGKKRLHPAAQWKRILTKCDFWWSASNLRTDDFLKSTLRENDGWCPVSALLTFRSFQHWITSPLTIVDALTSSAAASKWRVEERLDANGNYQWYVRRTTVTVATIDQWERELEQSFMDPQNHEDDDDDEDEDDDEEAVTVAVRKRNQIRSLPLYTLAKDTEIIVVKKPSELASLCTKLNKAMQLQQPNTKMLALDVEYATLEFDIRRSLPAMMQLATPKAAPSSSSLPSKIIGLIWLHKFPHFGRSIMNPTVVPNPDHSLHSPSNTSSSGNESFITSAHTDQHFQEYEPLRQLLADTSIAKVGLGIHQDVINLLRWWGIQSEDQAYFVTNLMDLTEDDSLSNVDDDSRSLQDICGIVLKQQLLKDKTKP